MRERTVRSILVYSLSVKSGPNLALSFGTRVPISTVSALWLWHSGEREELP